MRYKQNGDSAIMYNAFEEDIAILHVYWESPTALQVWNRLLKGSVFYLVVKSNPTKWMMDIPGHTSQEAKKKYSSKDLEPGVSSQESMIYR